MHDRCRVALRHSNRSAHGKKKRLLTYFAHSEAPLSGCSILLVLRLASCRSTRNLAGECDLRLSPCRSLTVPYLHVHLNHNLNKQQQLVVIQMPSHSAHSLLHPVPAYVECNSCDGNHSSTLSTPEWNFNQDPLPTRCFPLMFLLSTLLPGEEVSKSLLHLDSRHNRCRFLDGLYLPLPVARKFFDIKKL